jgi:hypothetical protein
MTMTAPAASMAARMMRPIVRHPSEINIADVMNVGHGEISSLAHG